MPIKALCTIFSAVTLITVLSACSNQPAPARPKPANIDELERAIADVLAKYHAPGCGFAIVRKDRIEFAGGVGKADLAADREVTADTTFRIGSITKSFVALSILKLQEQGKIHLGDKVRDLAPEIPIDNPWEATDPITVANLLEHTAGFDDFPLAEFYDFEAPPQKPLLWPLREFPGPQHVRWRPGSRTSYSNPGYGAAGVVLETASGMDAEDFIGQNILAPLGMTHSDIRLTPVVQWKLAQGYNRPPIPVRYRAIYLRTAGEMKSSPADMARFVRMMLNRGELDGERIVSADSITRMETPTTSLAARAGLKYGYALGNYADVGHPIVAYGHDGGLDGFLSRYAYIPGDGVGYFFSINCANGSVFGAIGKLLYDYVTRGLSPAKEPAAELGPGAAQYPGFYSPASPRREKLKFAELLVGGVFVSLRDGTLYRRAMFGGAKKLVPAGTKLFRTEDDPAATMAFTTDRDGEAVLVLIAPPARPIPAYFVRTSPAWPVMRLALITLAILTMASSILFALIWIPRKLFGRMRGVGHLSVRAVPLLAVVSLVAFNIPAVRAAPIDLVRPDFITLSIFLASIAFPILSILGLVLAIRSFRFEMNPAARIHSLLVSAACAGLTWYFAYWGLIGLRVWAA